MSRADEIFANIGQDEPVPAEGVMFYQLSAKDMIKKLEGMGPSAALGSRTGKQAIKEVLWETIEPLIKTFAVAPDGKTLIEVK